MLSGAREQAVRDLFSILLEFLILKRFGWIQTRLGVREVHPTGFTGVSQQDPYTRPIKAEWRTSDADRMAKFYSHPRRPNTTRERIGRQNASFVWRLRKPAWLPRAR